MKRLVLLAAVCAAAHQVALAEEPTRQRKDEAAIRATADAFLKAFNRGDAKAVAALWTENGTLADDRGQWFKGRRAIENEYAAFFKQQPGAKMEVAIQSLDFPAPGVAVEDGLARVAGKDGAQPAASRYTAVHVLQNGKWLMASTRESGIELPSNYGRLRQLQCLIGDWETRSEGTVVQTRVRWIAQRSFLERQYTVRQDGVTTASGLQIIGWDPQSSQVHSWSFDSSGGHGAGAWTPIPQGWRIASTGVLADGTPTSSQDLLTRVPDEENVLGWQSVNRRVGNTQLPDTREVVLERLPEKLPLGPGRK